MLHLLFAVLVPIVAATQNAAAVDGAVEVRLIDQHSLCVLPVPFSSRQPDQTWTASATLSRENGTDVQPRIDIFESDKARTLVAPTPKVIPIVEKAGFSFAHEATAYFPTHDQLFFASNAGSPEANSSADMNNAIYRIDNLTEVIRRAERNQASFEQDLRLVNITSNGVQMTNGGTPYTSRYYLVANQGRRDDYPPTLALIDRHNVHEPIVLINNANGRQFNSPNDVVVHARTGALLFTDPNFGVVNGFRAPQPMPQVSWQFNPLHGELQMLDTTVKNPNGLVLSPDQGTLYITQAGNAIASGFNTNISSAIFAFDVAARGRLVSLYNRRLFAQVPTTIADGIKVDKQGNVYSCLGDGVYVWDPTGVLLMRIFLPDGGCSNLAFANRGRLIVMANSKVLLVQLHHAVEGPALDSYPDKEVRIKLA